MLAIATTLVMHAMVGRPSRQLKMPRPAAYANLAGTTAGLGAGTTAETPRSLASLRQPCTMFAFNPCDIATFATDARGAAHCSSTSALNSTLCRLRETTLSSAIVSTYFHDGHDR